MIITQTNIPGLVPMIDAAVVLSQPVGGKFLVMCKKASYPVDADTYRYEGSDGGFIQFCTLAQACREEYERVRGF